VLTTTLVEKASGWLERRTSRRTFLQRVAVVGSAMSVSGLDYVLRPGTAYASVCGSGSTCASGWTALCCTIHHGVNQCPPGSFAGGWWKADGAGLCGGSARYYIDCHPRCQCGCGGGQRFCSQRCWGCRPHCAHEGTCDERRVCHNVFRYGQCNQHIGCSGPVWCRVISCSPPWQWTNCSPSSATDNNTRTHNAPCLATSWTPLQARYKAMGSQGSALGPSTSTERDASRGRVQSFLHGRMYHSDAAGTHFLLGAISTKYAHVGGTSSAIGLPTGDTVTNTDKVGRHNVFQHGAIYSKGSVGAHVLREPIYSAWKHRGYISGPLGYPTRDVARERDGVGWYGEFEHGGMSAASTKAPVRYALNPIWKAWRRLGGPHGPLGYLTTNPVDNPDHVGTHNDCHNGTVTTAAKVGTHGVWGPIFDFWLENYGREAGRLGHPISDIEPVTNQQGITARCRFQHGVLLLHDDGTVTEA
jgi:hypothetical protein